MSQGPIPIDPRLLGAVKRALGRMPAVPYDLTQVKVLDNFYSPVDPYWDNVPEGFVLTPGEFSAIGRMEKLRQLSVVLSSRNQTLDMGDFSWLPRCKNLQHLDLALTNFSDCAQLLQLPALKTVRLPGREQLVILAHGGTQMSVMERFALPRKEYHEWLGPNAGGYILEADPAVWAKDHTLQCLASVQYTKDARRAGEAGC